MESRNVRTEREKTILNYSELRLRAEHRGLSAALSVCSLLCPGVPAAGMALGIGPLYLLGGIIAPAVGIAMAIAATRLVHRGSMLLTPAALGILINVAVMSYFALLMVRMIF